jgi:dTDP-4-amino-4,6-dideoxygalactose transaminase
MNKIRVSRSCVGLQEASALRRVILEDGYLGMGQEVHRFEQELGRFLGGKVDVICVNSGTAALHLAVMAVVKPGEEVLVPSLTFVSSFQAITAAGAVPVACDIDPQTLLLDLDDARKRLTRRTKAIMPVHYSGGVGDLKSVYEFAKKYKLRVIEDAAHAFGTTYKGKKIGSFGDIVCFSFDGIKNITSGEGGAVLTADRKVAEFVKDARLLGIKKDTEKRFKGQRSWEFDVTHQGFRYHMSNLMAAIGRVQLKGFPKFVRKRQLLAMRYEKNLAGCPGLSLVPRDYRTVVPHIFPVRILRDRRTALRDFLGEQGIETGIHYFPNHRLKFFHKTGAILSQTQRIYGEILSLPLHPKITNEQQDRIINGIIGFLQGGKI